MHTTLHLCEGDGGGQDYEEGTRQHKVDRLITRLYSVQFAVYIVKCTMLVHKLMREVIQKEKDSFHV